MSQSGKKRSRQIVEEEADYVSTDDTGRQESEAKLATAQRKKSKKKPQQKTHRWVIQAHHKIDADEAALFEAVNQATEQRTSSLNVLAQHLHAIRTTLSSPTHSARSDLTSIQTSTTARIKQCQDLLGFYTRLSADFISATSVLPESTRITHDVLDRETEQALAILRAGKDMALQEAIETIAPGTCAATTTDDMNEGEGGHHVGAAPRQQRDQTVKRQRYVDNGRLVTRSIPATDGDEDEATSDLFDMYDVGSSPGKENRDPRAMWVAHVAEMRSGPRTTDIKIHTGVDAGLGPPLKDLLSDLAKGVGVMVRKLPRNQEMEYEI